MAECKDYEPGTRKGKIRPVCIFYMDDGACKRPNHFMCEYWLEKQPIKKTVSKKEVHAYQKRRP
jgi:hypothetical protein